MCELTKMYSYKLQHMYVFLILLNVFSVNTSCIAEEGNKHSLECKLHKSGTGIIRWTTKRKNNQERFIQNCFTATSCKCENPRNLIGNYSATLSCDTMLTSTLTIESVSRHSTQNDGMTWACVAIDSSLSPPPMFTVCDPLDIYAKPEKPNCFLKELRTGDTQLSMTCVTNKVFPEAKCQLYNNNDTRPLALVASSITYNTSTTNTDPVYYKTTCTINIDVSTLGVGQHQLFVKMFPNVADGLNIAGKDSDIIPVNLSYPQVEVSSNCFNGPNVKGNFIKTGIDSSCTCTMTNTGNPPGQIQWYRQGNSTPIGSLMSDRSVRFTITEANTARLNVYYCQARSTLNGKIQTVEFRREFAYGPGPVTLKTDGSNSYDICPGENPTVLTVSCQVPIDSVNPKPVFVVSFGNQLPTSRHESSTNTVYKGDYTFSLNSGGIRQLSCEVMNSVFDDLRVRTSKNITVRGPPATTPTIKISDGHYSGMNGNVAIVTNDIAISCYSEGGYPLPDMNLWCESDHDYSSTSQGKTELNLKFEAKKKSDKCFCTAKYMNSRCPTNKTSLVTLVFYEDPASVDEAAIVGGYLGLIQFPLIVLVIVVFIVLKKTGKLTRCGKPGSDQEQKRFPDTVRPVEDFESSVSMSQHQNEAFDGYEVPVNIIETNVDAKSKLPDRLDGSKPLEKGDGVTAYENTV